MSRHFRFAALALALLVPALALARFTQARRSARQTLELAGVPTQVGPWSAREQRALTSEESELLEPDDYVARRYEASGRSPIWLYVALYSEQSSFGKGAHDPAVCYPAQGWEVLSTRSVTVDLEHGEAFVGTLFVAHQGKAEQEVLYWFQPAGRWPRHQAREQVSRIWDAVAGQPQYAFVRLAAASVPGSDTEEDLREFARLISWPVRLALGREHRSGSTATGR